MPDRKLASATLSLKLVCRAAVLALLLSVTHLTAQVTPAFNAQVQSPYFIGTSLIRAGVPFTINGRLLPADATGTMTFYVDGNPVQTSPVAPMTVGDYTAVGDSITLSGYIADPAQRYQSIVGAALNLNVNTMASFGYTACDSMLYNVIPKGIATATVTNSLYSLFVGNNEILQYGIGANEALFNLCDQALLVWLGLPPSSRILIGDPAITIPSGAWTTAPAFGSPLNALTNTSGSGTVRFSMTTYGGAAYLWYLLQAGTTGSFAVSVDGGPPGPTTSTLFPPTTQDNIPGAYALLRIPVAAGAHTFDITAQSGTVSVFGMATPPAAGGAVPTVLAADTQNNMVPSLASAIAEYTLDTQANVGLLHSDGLDIRFVPTQHYMFATAAEMEDTRHPNALGLSEIAQAFLSVVTPTAPASGSLAVAGANYINGSLQPGPHGIGLYYSGDQKYASANSGSLAVAYDPTSSVSLDAGASIFPIQTPITLSATIPNANAIGLVSFFDVTGPAPVSLGSSWANNPAGTATLTIPSLSAGSHALMVQYAGDIYNSASASPSINLLVSGTYTTTALTSPATRYYGGNTESFTATISPATATGTVTFLDGPSILAQQPVSGGTASFSTTTLAEGVHSITASYSGSSTNDPSQSPALNIAVAGNPATIALSPLPASSPYGTPLTLTATISPPTATGYAGFLDNAVPLGQFTIVNGVTTITTSSTLAVGTHTFTAVYSGDNLNLPAISSAVSTQVTVAGSTISLAPIPAAIAFGTPLTLTATVTPSAATGTITFTDSISGPLGQVTLVNGTASISTAALAPGSHSLTASYSGDSTHPASASAAQTTNVTTISPSITLATLPASINIGSPLTLTATITPATATGTIIFRDPAFGVLGQATVSHGTATLTLPNPALGSYTITAVYSGDTGDSAATSAPFSTQVVLASTSLALTASVSTALVNTPITLTASLSTASASGSVTFFDGSATLGAATVKNGSATLTTSTLAVGPHTLHAVYSGDSLDATSTSATLSETITNPATSTALTLAQSSLVAGSTVTVNIRVSTAAQTPTGIVTVRSGATTLASGTLANGSGGSAYATLSFNSATLGLGIFPLAAYYAGDATDTASDSSATPAALTVTGIPTTAALTLSAAQIPALGSAAFAIHVTATAAMPTGSVTFLSNGTALGSVALDTLGNASFTLNSAAVGSYAISANYTPSGLFAAAATGSHTLTVTPPLTAALTPATVSAAPGKSATATLSVTPLSGFSGTMQTACVTTASFVTCSVNAPSSINGVLNLPVQISVSSTTLALSLPGASAKLLTLAMLLPLLALRRTRRALVICMALACVLSLGGCAEGGTFGSVPTGPQTVAVTITAAGTPNTTYLAVNVVQ